VPTAWGHIIHQEDCWVLNRLWTIRIWESFSHSPSKDHSTVSLQPSGIFPNCWRNFWALRYCKSELFSLIFNGSTFHIFTIKFLFWVDNYLSSKTPILCLLWRHKGILVSLKFSEVFKESREHCLLFGISNFSKQRGRNLKSDLIDYKLNSHT